MEARFTIHILPDEWRWAIILASLLVLLAFTPLVWIAVSGTNDWQFMGTLHNYQDGGTYLSKMMQGAAGNWLLHFWHTPEPHHGAFIQVVYPLLGQIAGVTALSPLLLFHVVRVGASLFMYLALYHLGASIWQKVRTRRIFFIFAALGSGLGWLAAPLFDSFGIRFGEPGFPDLQVPEAYPLYSSFMNVHFPLALACLALMSSIIILAFRPGAENNRHLDGSLFLLGVLSVALALLYPQALVPFTLALGLYFLVSCWRKRKIVWWMLRWISAIVLPTLPIAIYYIAIVNNIPAFGQWNQQNVTAPPHPLALVFGLGIPLILALPILLRDLRRFFSLNYDDRFMLLWLLAMLIAMYIPTNIGRRFMIGMMIPLAYFVTRALEDYWFTFISRRRRGYFFAIIIPLMIVSQVFALFLPALPILAGNPAQSSGIVLQASYASAFRWLAPRTDDDTIILAAPVVATWVPGWVGARVIYGHPYETLMSAERRAAVVDWYQREADAPICTDLIEQYNPRYILVGPQERSLGSGDCAENLRWMATFGDVDIYTP